MRRHGKHKLAAMALASAVAIAAGCGDDTKTTDDAKSTSGSGTASSSGDSEGSAASKNLAASDGSVDSTASVADLVSRGERIYNVNCIACHHRDPSQDGGLGPPVAGSSRELIEARVMRGEYPPGYTPKADTRLMIPLPHLEPELDALAAFLESRAK